MDRALAAWWPSDFLDVHDVDGQREAVAAVRFDHIERDHGGANPKASPPGRPLWPHRQVQLHEPA